MPGKRSFEEQIAALDSLRQQDREACIEPLRKALEHRNNFVVAKAGDLARDFQLQQLLPELLAAFERFFDNPVKTDPQCWAKNSLSRGIVAGGEKTPNPGKSAPAFDPQNAAIASAEHLRFVGAKNGS